MSRLGSLEGRTLGSFWEPSKVSIKSTWTNRGHGVSKEPFSGQVRSYPGQAKSSVVYFELVTVAELVRRTRSNSWTWQTIVGSPTKYRRSANVFHLSHFTKIQLEGKQDAVSQFKGQDS